MNTLFRIGLNKLTVITIALLTASCNKEEETTLSLEDGKSTVVYDLAGDTKASMVDGVNGKEKRDFYTFLFDLGSKKQIWLRPGSDSSAMKTNQWDLAFSGAYNSVVFINNATQQGNPGFGGLASATAIVLLNQSYESVTSAPSDAEFDSSTIVSVGQANSEQPSGWYSYDITTHIMKTYPNRTYALRLPDGKYAKLQLVNIYKSNPPAVTDLYWPAPYLTFRYFVQEDGSRDLKTN